MLASRRSWWRIAAAIDDQSARPVAPTRSASTTPRSAPVLKATGPQQIWSWDITDLRTPWRGVAFKAYSVIDIYSRKIVGWRVEERECDDLAVDMFEAAFAEHGLPAVVHADSGPAMRSTVLKDLLADLEHRPDPQPATGQQRQSVLRIGVPHHEVPAELPRYLRRSRCRPRLGQRIRVLVQPASPPQRHRTVHPRRGPQRNVDTAMDSSATKPYRPTTTPTPNGSATAHIPTVPVPSSASTSQPKPQPNDSKQLDNARQRTRTRRIRRAAGPRSPRPTGWRCDTRAWVGRPRTAGPPSRRCPTAAAARG